MEDEIRIEIRGAMNGYVVTKWTYPDNKTTTEEVWVAGNRNDVEDVVHGILLDHLNKVDPETIPD